VNGPLAVTLHGLRLQSFVAEATSAFAFVTHRQTKSNGMAHLKRRKTLRDGRALMVSIERLLSAERHTEVW
jgi:hypothetical protein